MCVSLDQWREGESARDVFFRKYSFVMVTRVRRNTLCIQSLLPLGSALSSVLGKTQRQWVGGLMVETGKAQFSSGER